MNVAILGGGNGSLRDRRRPRAGRPPPCALAAGRRETLAPLHRRVARSRWRPRGDGAARPARSRHRPISRRPSTGAEVVIAPLPATGHDGPGRRLVGRASPARQIVAAHAGHARRATRWRATLARAGGQLPFAFAETGTLPYLARKTGAATAVRGAGARGQPAASASSRRRARSRRWRACSELFPAIRPCADALDAALTNAGPVDPSAAGAAERGPDRRRDASTSTPPARRRASAALIDAVDAERVMPPAGACGYPAPHYELATYYDEARAAAGLYGAGAGRKLVASGLWREILTYEHRYVTRGRRRSASRLFESAGRTGGASTRRRSRDCSGVFRALLRAASSPVRPGARVTWASATSAAARFASFLREGWESPMWAKVLR